jgi:hypothetical protein
MKMRKQRLMGAGLVVITWLLLLLACTGTTPEEQDATAALLTFPIGLYMLYSDTYVLYDNAIEGEANTHHTSRKESIAWQERE